MEWNKSVWESDLDIGLRTLRLAVDTHAITSHFAIPLLIKTPGGLVVEVTDGTDEYNADQLPGLVLLRPGQGVGESNGVRAGARAEAARSDGRLAHSRLAAIGVHARGVRRHRSELARRDGAGPALRHFRESGVRRSGRRGARAGSRRRRAGTDSRCPADSSRRSTDSPISTAASPMPGDTSSKFRTSGKPADVTGYR